MNIHYIIESIHPKFLIAILNITWNIDFEYPFTKHQALKFTDSSTEFSLIFPELTDWHIYRCAR